MRAIIPILLFLAGMPVTTSAAEPKFYEKEVGSMRECEALFTTLVTPFSEHSKLINRDLPGGGKQVVQCMPDGVVELHCDPKKRRAVVAVLEDETLPACRKSTPALTVRNADTLITQ
ncbi:MAG: hypothetical protein DI528_08945 [Shinella sp.]|nr:MAG: hypothetical protein DI528_08945 [Shinella sp.]